MRAPLSLLLALAVVAPGALAGGCPPEPEAALQALNALRAQAQVCGGQSFAAAPALRWQARLGESARRFAEELARQDRLDHIGANGATLRTRLREAGYAMREAGENLAGGSETLDEALAQWLASPTHCENLMAPGFQEAGLACVVGPGKWQRYWVLHLAAPAK